jgi:filamentous hemagglutinin family protein
MPKPWTTLALLAASSFLLEANPTGGSVAAGTATIAGQGSPSVTINQASNTAIINWNTFSIGSGELTKFIQPSSTSAALNRVLGGQTSFINGTLSANGQIYLINGNGIVVGPGGIITTAGFTGSTRDIADSDFMSGKLHFTGSSDAGVTNLGTITALGGDVVLIGKTVDNKGTINASGTAGLVAGDDVMLEQQNADGSTITVDPVSDDSAPTGKQKVGVKNSGTITASTAELKAANGNIYALAIENTGLVRATTLTQQGGHIYLTSDSGTIANSGTLDASATAAKGHGGTVVLKSASGKVVHSGKILARGGQGGTGGQVEISGAQVAITGTVDTRADGGTTGDFLLDPATLTVISGGAVTSGSGATQANPNNNADDVNDPNSSTITNGTVNATLASTNLTLSAQNNITINAAILWDSGNSLALETTAAGSTININAGITNTHATTGSLILDAATATDIISTSINGTINVPNFILQRGAWVQLVNVGGNGGNIPQTLVNGVLTNVLPAFTTTNDFEITGGTFLRADSGNGNTVYYGLEDVYGLQGVKGFLNSNFTLNNNTIDATGTPTWNSGSGFAPIGSAGTPYTGEFDNGTINGLTITLSDSTDVGLFAALGSNAYVSGLYLTNFNITGGTNVGALTGDNAGQAVGVYVEYGTVTGQTDVGGLAGSNESGAQLYDDANYYSTVSGTSYVGGGAGYNDGLIYSFQGYAYVTGQSFTGGVAGENDVDGTINVSTDFESVTGDDSEDGSSYIGGITGENDGTVTASYTFPNATVSGNFEVGGIAGYNTGTISDSYNSATVTGTGNDSSNIGGIAGDNNSTSGEETADSFRTDSVNGPEFTPSPGLIQTSYNTGTIDGTTAVGGIVGLNDQNTTVNTCYNVGSIGDGNAQYVGGIVGDNYGYVTNTYNSGPVQGAGATTAGIIGLDEYSANTENSYWDTVTSGQSISTNRDEGSYEINLAPVSSTDGTAYTISGNGTVVQENLQPNGYGFFGAATAVAGTNGVYQIGTSPDSGGGPAWYIIEGQTRPLLAMELNGNINSPHQLQLIAVNLTGSYYITSSLDMSVITNPAEIWNTAGFVPIGADPGSGGYAFNGYVYGNGDTIQSLYIDRPSTSDVGLFGYAGSDSSINEVVLNDSSITGANNVGGVAGVNLGSIEDVQNNNDGTGAITGVNNVGGIAGDNFGELTYDQNNLNSEANATVIGTGDNIGGIAGTNESGATVGEDTNSATINGAMGSDGIGGIVGTNDGVLTQSINTGNVGSGVETNVGGLAGNNYNQVDDSYSGGGSDAGTIDGAGNVGGLVGGNQTGGVLETSYSTSTVTGGDGSSTGSVVGANAATVRHVYWDTDVSGDQPGIAENVDTEDTIDVAGYTTAQLTDMANFAQGASPVLWDFSPQNGENQGVWGINVYNYNGQVNGGLPVLQWQYPVNAEIAVVGGTQNYGYTPTSTETGSGVSQLGTELPSGPTYTGFTGNQAGDTDQITVTGNPVNYGFNIEYVNGTVNIVPAPLDIVANSIVVASGQPIPPYSATYTGLENGDTASDLDGTLVFTVTPQPDTAIGQHTITPSGQSSSNYDITYFSGILNVTTLNPTPSQIASTFTAEAANLQNQFSNDPYNGLDPIYYLTIPSQFAIAGDLFGAINNEPDATDYAYASSTSDLPAFSRLATPESGVVEIIDGVVVVGDPKTGKPVFLNQPGAPLSQSVLAGLQGVLSPSVYNELLALIHGQ